MNDRRSPFGNELRGWRRQRGLSQLDLAIAADSTSRHISFLETGRSRPSAPMVERLAEALDIPVRERNPLFEAAGLPGPYAANGAGPLLSEPFRFAVELSFPLLAGHRGYVVLVACG